MSFTYPSRVRCVRYVCARLYIYMYVYRNGKEKFVVALHSYSAATAAAVLCSTVVAFAVFGFIYTHKCTLYTLCVVRIWNSISFSFTSSTSSFLLFIFSFPLFPFCLYLVVFCCWLYMLIEESIKNRSTRKREEKKNENEHEPHIHFWGYFQTMESMCVSVFFSSSLFHDRMLDHNDEIITKKKKKITKSRRENRIQTFLS